jgi:hypothetical protein
MTKMIERQSPKGLITLVVQKVGLNIIHIFVWVTHSIFIYIDFETSQRIQDFSSRWILADPRVHLHCAERLVREAQVAPKGHGAQPTSELEQVKPAV